MYIFFNELCFWNIDIDNIDNELAWCHKTLNVLSKQHYIYSKLETIKDWKNTFYDSLDKPSRNYIDQMVKNLSDCERIGSDGYYYYLKNQNLGIVEHENVLDSSIHFAVEKELQYKNRVAILNFPDAIYNQRSHLPILKSFYEKEKLVLVQTSFIQKKILSL